MPLSEFDFLFIWLPVMVSTYWTCVRWFGVPTALVALQAFSLLYIQSFSRLLAIVTVALVGTNYLMGRRINELRRLEEKQPIRVALLSIGILLNLAPLFYFKYAASAVSFILAIFGKSSTFSAGLLPIGISFFTFVQIIFLWEMNSASPSYAEISFRNYLQTLTFFPHLVAGPLVTPVEFEREIRYRSSRGFDHKPFALGLFLIAIGLFKKLTIADALAENSSLAFDAGARDGIRSWISVFSYTFQLYFDFSGYIDIARGVSLLFGITLPQNFDSPLRKRNIQDFWKTWHISLTRIANLYVYSPVSIWLRRLNLNSKFTAAIFVKSSVVPTLFTFVLLGVWHGAGVNFVLFGLWHGIGILIHKAWTRLGFSLPSVLSWLLTIFFVSLGFVLFRSSSLDEAFSIYGALFEWRTFVGSSNLTFFIFNLSGDSTELWRVGMIAVGFFVAIFPLNSGQLERRFKPSFTYLVWAFLALLGALPFFDRQAPFLYWQF